MDKEIQCDSNTRFFLSTDDEKVEKTVVEKYGKRIIVRSKVLQRNKPDGIYDAMIDMYCLSLTSKIYGSYWSSFSDVAAKWGHKELCIVTK